MRTKTFLAGALCAFLAGCSEDDDQRTKAIDPGPAAVSRPARQLAPLDAAIEEAIREALQAQVDRVAAGDPNWAGYPTLTDDSRRSDMQDEPAPNQVRVYLRGLGFYVPVDTLERVSVAILPDRVELELQYPSVSVSLVDSTGSKEVSRIPEEWRAAAPVLDDARWREIQTRVASVLGDGAPGKEAIDERVSQYRLGTRRWEPAFFDEFDTRMKFMKGALWASADMVKRFDLTKAYMAARLMMSKPAVVASIPGPAAVPIAPVLGGPIFGLQRGKAGSDPEIHGAMSGADGVWVEVRMSSGGARPISESESFVNGFFDSMRPFEPRVSDAAATMGKMKAARKEEGPAATRKAALLALSAFHLDPRAKRAQDLVETWARMEPRPDAATMETLVDQIVAWADGGPQLRERLASELEKSR